MLRRLSLFAALVCLPTLAAAADPAMLELIMPDARVVVEINLDRIAASPIGQAMSPQMKAELASLRPTWGDTQSNPGGLDWSHYAQQVIFASGTPPAPAKPAPSLTIVHGLLDPVWIDSLNAFRGSKTNYLGVPLLSSGGANDAVVGFLDGSIAVIGQAAEVKAAIRRRGVATPPSPVLAEGLSRFEGQYDIWMVSAGVLGPVKSAGGVSLKWLDRTDAFSGGMRFSPDFELSADMTMRTEKDVAQMEEDLRWFASVVQTQEQTALSLDDMNFQMDGRRMSVSLEVPEQQVRAALQQRQNGQVAHFASVRPPEIESGLPEPPSGTVRVQSSPADMGTTIVPVTKNQ